MWDTYKGKQRKSLLPFIFYRATGKLHSPKIHATIPRIRQLATYENFRIEKIPIVAKVE